MMRPGLTIVLALLIAGCNVGHDAERSLAPIHPVAVSHGNEATYPAPTNLSISRLLFTWIQWSAPPGLPLLMQAYIYRNTENDFSTATLLTRTISHSYFDHDAESGVQYWYWVRYGDGTNFGPAASTGWPEQTPGTPQPPTTPPELAEPERQIYEIAPASLQAGQDPVLLSQERMQVGSIPEPDMDSLHEIVWHNGVVLYGGGIRDGVSSTTLQEYLSDDARDWGSSVVRLFRDAPTVRIQKGATRGQIRETVHAVQLLNYWLPHDWKLGLDLRPVDHGGGQPSNGDIIVEFADRATWTMPGGGNTVGKARKWFSGATIYSAEVWVDYDRAEGNTLATLVHELLHALGRGHVDETAYPGTLMHTISKPVNGHVLHPLDRDALMAVYGVLGKLTYSSTLATEFRSWADRSSYLAASLPDDDVQFGVSTRNGFAQAWAAGTRPLYPLADNPALEGSASWDGRLVGYTADAESVAGNMNMTIDLTTMIGGLSFADIEKWAAGQDVGALGSGSIWNTGALNYDIRVSDNYLLRIGGDEGELTGAFFSNQHEAVGGTLYRADLTAGFGGTRTDLERCRTDCAPLPVTELPPVTAPTSMEALPGTYSTSSSSSTTTINGVTRRVTTQTTQIRDYGYWAKADDDTLFRASLDATGTVTNGVSDQMFLSRVSGRRTRSNPLTGTAMWTGGVRGVTGNFARVTGQSRITVDMGAETTDVSFFAFDDGRVGMAWNDLALRNGAFSHQDSASSISGDFYGAGHLGVAGKFDRDGLHGVFGALRTQGR